MKLLFDQNISYRIIDKIKDYFPDSKQVKELGLENKSDKEIWSYAKKYGFTIITFDSDFQDICALYGSPPKIVWLRTGNNSTDNIAAILIQRYDIIKEFLDSKSQIENSILELFLL